MITCEKCGGVLAVGSFPFCKGQPSDHAPGIMRVNSDEVDYIDHNLGQEPIRITSWSQRRAIMAARGLVDYEHDVPVPEGMAENKQRPTHWSAYRLVTPEHLQWLGERLATGKAEKEPEDAPLTVNTWTSVGDPSERYR